MNTGNPREDIPMLLEQLQGAFRAFLDGRDHFTMAHCDDAAKQTRFVDAVGPSSRNQTSPQTVHTPDVPSQFMYLSQTVEENAKLVIALQDRLAQYLRPEDAGSKGECSAFPSPTCAAGDQLRQLSEEVVSINNRLVNTLHRLEAS